MSRADIKDLLNRAFAGTPAPPKHEKRMVEAQKSQERAAPQPPKKELIDDPFIGASAQSFYDPAFKNQAAPESKPIPEKDMNTGTAPKMSIEGAWGHPEPKR